MKNEGVSNKIITTLYPFQYKIFEFQDYEAIKGWSQYPTSRYPTIDLLLCIVHHTY
jgi:hypothetical protein